jgi:hypothetical protein
MSRVRGLTPLINKSVVFGYFVICNGKEVRKAKMERAKEKRSRKNKEREKKKKKKEKK